MRKSSFTSFSVLLPLVLASSLTFAQDDGCGIACMLDGATVFFGDRSFPLSSGEELRLTDARCTSLAVVSALPVEVTPSALHGRFHVQGLSSRGCSLSFEIVDPATNASHSAGDAALAANATELLLGARLLRNKADGVVDAAEVTSCNASVGVSVLNASTAAGVAALREVFGSNSNNGAAMLCDALVAEAADWTSTLADAADVIRQYEHKQPVPPPPDYPGPNVTDLRQSALVNVLRYAVDDCAGTAGLDGLLNIVTNNTGKAWANLSDPYVSGILGGYFPVQDTDVFYSVPEGTFAEINKWASLKAIQNAPESNYTIMSEAALEGFAFNATLTIDASISNAAGEMLGEMLQSGVLSLSFDHPSVLLRVTVLVNSSAISDLAVSQYVDWQCLLHAVIGVSIPQLEFNATGGSAASAGLSLVPGGDIEPEFHAVLNAVGEIVAAGYKTSAVGLTNGYYLGQLNAKLNNLLAQVLSNDWPCNATVDPLPKPIWNALAVKIAFGVALLIFLVIAIVVCILPPESRQSYSAVATEEDHMLRGGTPAPQPAVCLMRSQHIPAIVRFAVPLLVLGNMAMFVTSNTSVATSVYPAILLGTHNINIGALFDFGLISTVKNMWQAGTIPLAILIGLLSGIWPYVKLVLMLVCWLVPPGMLVVRKRELVLMMLDALGKWSLIDAYVMTLMMVAFRFHVVVPTHADSPAPGSAVDLFVGSHPGFDVFVWATMLSLATGHVIIALHRHVEYETRRQAVAGTPYSAVIEAERPLALRSLAFPAHWRRSTRIFFEVLIGVMLVTGLALLCVGISVESVRFDIGGLAGWALDAIKQNPLREYSLIQMAAQVPKSAMGSNHFTPMFILVVLLGTAVAVPMLHLLLLLLLWLVPLPYKHQRRFYIVVETLNAWSAIEVYTVSIIVALLQIRQFATWMIGDNCDLLNPLIAKYFDGPLHGNDVCFDVTAHIERGSWILLASCVMYVFSAIVVMRRCHRALAEREPLSKSSIN